MERSKLKYFANDRIVVEKWTDYNDWSLGFSVGYQRGFDQSAAWFHLELGPWCFSLGIQGKPRWS